MSWTFIYLMVGLKIPIFALLYLVWWAIHQTPETEGLGDGGSARPRPPRALAPPAPSAAFASPAPPARAARRRRQRSRRPSARAPRGAAADRRGAPPRAA